MNLSRTLMAMPVVLALPVIALPMIAFPGTGLAGSPDGADADVSVTGLSVTRPASEDALNPARTQVSLHIAMPGQNVVGLGPDSRITTLEDDTGQSLLDAERQAEEDQTEPFRAPPGLTWRNALSPGAADGNLRRDEFEVGGREGWLEVTIDAPNIPALGAAQLTIAGEIVVMVASEDEERHQVHGIDLSEGSAEFEVGGETVSCMRDRAITQGDLDISEFYCWSRSLQPTAIEVIDQDDAPPSPMDRSNLVVVGDASDISLDVTFPATTTVPVLVTETFGLNL